MASQHETKKAPSSTPTSIRRRSNLRPIFNIYWNDVGSDTIRLAIDAATRCGAAIMFGRTSDGGALSVCILDGDTKIKEYPHTAEEATTVLKAVAEEFVDL